MEKEIKDYDRLKGKVILITGGCGDIGMEIARNCEKFGANVVILENDKNKIENYTREKKELGNLKIIECDIGDINEIEKVKKLIFNKYKRIDVIINNATIVKIGKLEEIEPEEWDLSYNVNLKGPVLLIKAFLPYMKEKNSGTIVFMPSSGAVPYMGCYEILKTAQIELCNTLSMELERLKINTYCVGPGYVKTMTTKESTEQIAGYMGISQKEFDEINKSHELTKEEAGLGVALSLLVPEKYNGKEVGSIQVLLDEKIKISEKEENKRAIDKELENKIEKIYGTYKEQYDGWLKRNIFEKQWVIRDFKKTTGYSVEEMERELTKIIKDKKINEKGRDLISKLGEYYKHQKDLNESYTKNQEKKNENKAIINRWIEEADETLDLMENGI